MKVRFAKDVLDDQNSWRKLDGFVDLFDEGRHFWDVDDIQLIEQSPWIQDNLSHPIGQENLEILQKSYTDGLYPNSENHRHSLSVCVSLQGNAEENNLTPEEAKRCLTTPAYVVVENAESDGAFLQTMMSAFKQQNLLDAHKNFWWRIESRGGATEINKNIQQIQDETIGPLRVFVLVDSDRLSPGYVKPAIQKLEQYCIDKNIPYAVLEKREIENYIPVDLLQGLKNKNTIYRAFLELTQQQRDYYDMKYGFAKDKQNKAIIREEQQALFKHVRQHILDKLCGGFGKNISHLFESKREQFSKDSIQRTCPDNPDELDNIFKQIEALI
ncbi:MAG: hypothetical protein ABFS56_01130 [Pseudomonadota bacterium]